MAKNYFIRYSWLIDTIRRHSSLSLGELQRLWRNSPLNETKEPLARRTFFNHRTAIFEMFGINIKYKKNYGFYIDNEDFDEETFKNICEISYLRKNYDEDMAKNLLKRCVWLIDTIRSKGPIDFDRLNEAWLNSALNEEHKDLPQRTFHNHKNAIHEMFGIEILHGADGYYISESDDDLKEIRNYMYETVSLSNLSSEFTSLHGKVFIDPIPEGMKHIGSMVEALKNNRELRITNQEFLDDEPETVILHPYCIRLHKQRWYVVGMNTKLKKICRYAFDRIKNIEETGRTFKDPKTNMEQCFWPLYGMVGFGEKPETVRLKVIDEQRGYLRSLPLHHSQKEVETTDEYSIFEYYMVPKWNFMMELLSMEDAVEVLEPKHFRELIANQIKDMYKVYFKE